MHLVSLRTRSEAFQACVQLFSDSLQEEKPLSQLPNCEQLLHERLCDSNREIVLFEHEGHFVGFAELMLEERCFPDEDLPELCVKILTFFIATNFRQQPIRSAALSLVKRWAQEREAAFIEIEVRSDVPEPNAFFANEGLELVGSGAHNCYRAVI